MTTLDEHRVPEPLTSEPTSGVGKPVNPLTADLPTIRTPLSPQEIVDALETAAKRGKLAGFSRGKISGDVFTLTDFGAPFESVLHASASESDQGGMILRFVARMKTKLLWGFVAILLFTIWPGVDITDSMLKTYISSYNFATWKWYLPLTVPFVPIAIWTAMKRSRSSAHTAAKELIRNVQSILDAHAAGKRPA